MYETEETAPQEREQTANANATKNKTIMVGTTGIGRDIEKERGGERESERGRRKKLTCRAAFNG